MKKTVLVCGLISGLIVSVFMLISIGFSTANANFNNGMLYGYAGMLLAFSLIFVGIKNYRDKYNQGAIGFGKAFRIGLYITLIASTMYVVVWLIDYYFFIPEFTTIYTEHMLTKAKASGASQVAIAQQAAEMARFNEMYKNPFFNALFTYMEILPVGLVISLICALILKRKAGKPVPVTG